MAQDNASPRSVHRLHAGDLVVLASDHGQLGCVSRTHEDTFSHFPKPAEMPMMSSRNHSVPIPAFDEFTKSGIPPPGVVLVTWVYGFGTSFDRTESVVELISASRVYATDRPMYIGDIVRKSAKDSMSGIVVSSDARLSVFNPRPFPQNGDDSGPAPVSIVDSIPANEMSHSLGFAPGRVIIYQHWVGRIVDNYPSIKLRLSDGSVVQLEDPDDIEIDAIQSPEGTQVGDVVKTKKGNIRRGQFVYGTYNANTAPQGYVVAVDVQEVEVKWLQSLMTASVDTESGPPPSTLTRDELDSAECCVYEYSRLPNKEDSVSGRPIGPNHDFALTDKMRFLDPVAAKEKYKGSATFIDRKDTLGYDLNIFTLHTIRTRVTVQWQDLTESSHDSVELLPSMDLDDSIQVWPGELVLMKRPKDPEDQSTYRPEAVGIVQTVRARDQLAIVKWFEGDIFCPMDDTDQVLPQTWTGEFRTSDSGEEVGLYDLWVPSDLARRIGDIIILCDPLSSNISRSSPRYKDVFDCLESPPEQLNWIGEVIELSLQGWLVVRLGASKTLVRDIRVPWECAYLACSNDQDEELDDESDVSDESYDDFVDDDIESGRDNVMHTLSQALNDSTDAATGALTAPWRDETGRVIDELDEQDDWATDDDEEEDATTAPRATVRDSDGDTAMPDTGDAEKANGDSARQSGSSSKFSYENMIGEESGIEQFAILEGTPDDHHFSEEQPTSDRRHAARVMKEHKMLRRGLPAGAFASTWEGNTNLIRFVLLGPLGTPYELAPFVVDVSLAPPFPQQPPACFFHSWTQRTGGPVNPNLYEDGKICLSLLGTWPGASAGDTWNATSSTLLQVVVSLLGLVLVREPFFNEAGFDVRAGSADAATPSALYSERVFLRARAFITEALRRDLSGIERLMHQLYLSPAPGRPLLARRALAHTLGVMRRSAAAHRAGIDVYATPSGDSDGSARAPAAVPDAPRLISAGAVRSLRRDGEALVALAPVPCDHDPLWKKLVEAWHALGERGDNPVELPPDVEAYITESGG